uniref:CHK kinase-like domain-containing protein n=1 Tax=Lygus hesperus TaxID=30085 RepID=A0A0A9W571_LYGHE
MEGHGLDIGLLKVFLKKRHHNEKVTEVISVSVENAVPEGFNFTSSVHRVKFFYLNAEGRKKTRSVVVKTEVKDEETKELVKEIQIFAVETRMYRNILSTMEDLMEEVGDKRDALWPKLLGFLPYHLMAFDDLLDIGYVEPKRRQCLDFNHAKLVLYNIAKFHAMSKVLMARGHITADDKGILGVARDVSMSRKGFEVVIAVMADAMVNNWGKEWTVLAEKLRKRAGSFPGELSSLAENYDRRFEVLNHGDLWICNILFRYMDCEEHIPISVKIIDYQVCHVNSFIWDVVHFLFSSTIPTVRRTRLNDLLESYHRSLVTNLNLFNFTGYIPSFEDLKSEWERVKIAQFAFCLTHILTMAEVDKPFEVAKLNTHPPHEVVHESVFNDGKALNSVGEDLRYLDEKGVL